MDILSLLLFCLIGFVTLIYFYFQQKFNYWKKRGVVYIKPKFPFGNMQGFKRTCHTSKLMQGFYNKHKGQCSFLGIYFFTSPVALLLDLDLIRNVLIKDFNYFHDRGMFYNERDDPLSAHLFSLDGHKWKVLRSKLTPTFTSGKMKFMFPTVVEVGQQFEKTLKEEINSQPEFEIKDILARFTTDVIGTCAFGINCNSLKDPNAEFRKMGKKVFEMPRNAALKQIFMLTSRELARSLRMKSTHDDVSTFFMKIVRETVEYREKNNVQRNDFMDLLIQLKNTGKLEDDTTNQIGAVSLEEIAAQAFVFFLAGFETSSTTMSYCLYELALHQEIQDRARDHINEILNKYDGKFTYEAGVEMVYIDQIVNESLRKYPPGANLVRKTTKNYDVPNTNQVIEAGTTVFIPVYAVHHDPDVYPDPEIFDPDRFTPDNVKQRHPLSFLPFGDGPRNCIGLRFGIMQARVGLVTLLRNFKFTICSKTTIPLDFSTTSVILTPKGGLWLHIEPL